MKAKKTVSLNKDVFDQLVHRLAIEEIAAQFAKMVRKDISRMTDEERRHLEYDENGCLIVDDERYPWCALRRRESA
jgi:hypothetical protein